MFVRRARLIASWLCIFAGALFFFGCPTPPKEPPRITPIRTAQPLIPQAPPEQSLQTVTIPSETSFAPLVERPESILPEEKLQLPGGLLPVQSWSAICGFSELKMVQKEFP